MPDSQRPDTPNTHSPMPTIDSLRLRPLPEGVDEAYLTAFIGRVNGWLDKKIAPNPLYHDAANKMTAYYSAALVDGGKVISLTVKADHAVQRSCKHRISSMRRIIWKY
jgi:hypothetical protein